MKPKIHPEYVECKVSCGCGVSFQTRSTRKEIHIETCSACHPFYTGREKLMDVAGRIEKFNKKYAPKKGKAEAAPAAPAAGG
jgi:large subunit ribosomal protein L31